MKALLYLFMFFSAFGYAQNNVLFEEANAAYADGNYELAVEKYGQILASGESAAEVHYNLANSHYKLNHIAPSIYHYEKALQLDPEDADIMNNLQFAQNMTLDAIEAAPENEISQWWSSLLSLLSTNGWAVTGIVLMVLFVVLFIAYYFSTSSMRKRIFFLTGMVSLVLALVCVSFGFARAEQLKNRNFAIVFAEEVEIKSEPNERGEELFLLHEGTKVKLLEDFEEWSKVEIANGNQGWMRREEMKKL